MASPTHSPLEAWLRLAFTPGVGPACLRTLLESCGDAAGILNASSALLRNAAGAELADAIRRGGNAEAATAALHWREQPGHHLLIPGDTAYPALLGEIPDPPPVLFINGNVSLLNNPGLAVVGSRNATAQGCNNAEAFARTLSDAGLTIVSGLALGVDAAAHRGGLAGASRSVAVIGTGIDVVYPARNRALAHALAEDGVLVSEFPLGTHALAGNFPRRNRILSGLALGCLVIEAAVHSGSLITARLAAEQGREVFALPGSIHSPLSKGCHLLIKQGAKLVDSAQDVLEELRFAVPARAHGDAAPAGAIDATATQVLAALGWDPCDGDTLSDRTGIAPNALQSVLLGLELAGEIAILPGGRIQRVKRGA
ncbi:MAG: DNA-processing protein DprA [Burkholderiales bacterium]